MAVNVIGEEGLKMDAKCFYTSNEIADGIPFNYYMHTTGAIAGGVGSMGRISSKSLCIPIPRSKKARYFHLLGFYLKSLFLLIAVVGISFFIQSEIDGLLLWLYSFLIILGGGVIVSVVYKAARVKPKHLYSKNYPVVKQYMAKGYRRGAHPMVSTTPIGIIIYIFRWLL